MKATVSLDVPNGSRIQFEISDYLRPEYHRQHPIGVEGRMFYEDGIELKILLHADGKRTSLRIGIHTMGFERSR
jgi:hypothetical protein